MVTCLVGFKMARNRKKWAKVTILEAQIILQYTLKFTISENLSKSTLNF